MIIVSLLFLSFLSNFGAGPKITVTERRGWRRCADPGAAESLLNQQDACSKLPSTQLCLPCCNFSLLVFFFSSRFLRTSSFDFSPLFDHLTIGWTVYFTPLTAPLQSDGGVSCLAGVASGPRRLHAKPGENAATRRVAEKGADVVIRVPLGTVVTADSGTCVYAHTCLCVFA